ncbi:conserved hypothetical protein [uncultured Defluviicoccus sp.]|uniref:ATP-grasp domain-containing protein n=1 Tax=metagenome TaxID=256318 RepID=A0A380TGJ8_9ZZZZ|nr:conserved hypothetical protein [uncultured Defluviicoccus sp.]
MLQIGVVTRHDDFHAYVVRQLLGQKGVKCSLLFADSMSWTGGMSWCSSGPGERDSAPGTLNDADGQSVIVSDLDVIWWRRLTGEPRIPTKLPKKGGVRNLVVNDCQAALLGLLLTEFHGTWISPPEATRYACNKQLQLRAAQRAGLRVPRTLVSQDPDRVRAFCAASKGKMIAKPVAGAQKTSLMTGLVTHEILTDEAIRICPAIYQEFIPGTRHLRISCFGDALHAAMLETDALDWRYTFDVNVTRFDLDGDTAHQIRRVLTELGLRMGMVDMKLDGTGAPVWLEVNPQGQFMFLEGMCNALPLSRHFCDFLISEARRASQQKAAVA